MFLTKKHISRRRLLRGAGVTLALPLLDSMIPAQTPLRKTAAVAAVGAEFKLGEEIHPGNISK